MLKRGVDGKTVYSQITHTPKFKGSPAIPSASLDLKVRPQNPQIPNRAQITLPQRTPLSPRTG
eukprot:5582662-Amphidinium_carterae.1